MFLYILACIKGRILSAMKLESNYELDIPKHKPTSGSYDWWYFDGNDTRGEYQFVVIFYEGCPFSSKYIRQQELYPEHISAKPESHPAISISIYRHGKPIYYSMSEYAPSEAVFSRDKISIRIGMHSLEGYTEGDQLLYVLRLDEVLPCGDRISAILRYISPKANTQLWADETAVKAGNHIWNLVQPLAQVKAVISISNGSRPEKPIIFDGLGYHDHNIGQVPMKNDFIDWYWGRVHFNDFTLVYYVMNTQSGKEYKAWLISLDNQTIINKSTNIIIDGASTNVFSLSSHRRIKIYFGEELITLQCYHTFDSGPFYMRFKSEASYTNANGTVIEECYGISEYIRPKRIHYRVFWPLVHMRYRFAADKAHWVQRSKKLYRWTW